MTVHNLPARGPLSSLPTNEPRPSTDLTYAVPMEEEHEGINWARVLHAFKRYKWLVLGVTILGTAAGLVATRFVAADYSVESTLWVDQLSRRTPGEANRGPLRGDFLEPEGWVDLLKSYQVLDAVVRDLSLFLELRSPVDSTVMKNLRLKEQFRPGEYSFKVGDNGKTWTLATKEGVELDHGVVGDSVGTRLGFLWSPSAAVVEPGRNVEFRIDTPRDAATRLGRRLDVHMDPDGNFLKVKLEGTNPRRVTEIVNAVVTRYIQIAADLKKQRLTEDKKILDEQLQDSKAKLETAENSYEGYRRETITLPGDRPGGADPAGDRIVSRFFNMQIDKDQMGRDREAIQRLLQQGGNGGIPTTALASIESVQKDPNLSAALKELAAKQAEMRTMTYKYNEDYPGVKRLAGDIGTLEHQTIPSLGAGLVRELMAREAELGQQIGMQSGTLKSIPARSMEEARLKRTATLAEETYTGLQRRYEEARIEEVSSTPDIRVLDAALTPIRPSKNTAPILVLIFFVGSLALASSGAVVLDRLDPRVRYPDQVSRDMGLTILGTVPHLKTRGGQYRLSREEAAEVVEALRGVCLNLVYANGGAGPLLLTVTSPGAGDGKSFLSANLALTFADGGHRTLLIDADLRRGVLHQRFRASRRPGLTDALRGESTLESVIRSTPFPSLSFLPCGSRTHSAPELLGSAAMTRLMEQVRANYDVIIVDSPPLSAGIDPCILGALAGNLIMVLRTGVSHRELATAKLDMLNRFPLRLLGAVLNDVPQTGTYRYYSYYLPGYSGEEEDSEKRPRELV